MTALASSKSEPLRSLTACGDCDLLLEDIAVSPGNNLRCPRCGHVLHRCKKDSVDRSLGLALAGLILFVPANLLPMLRLEVLGIEHSATMMTGVIALFENGMWALAIVVLLASIVVPLVKLLLVSYLTLSFKLKRNFPLLATCFRWFLHLDEWGMLEVYTLGIIVAYVKLVGMAQVLPELGLYSFMSVLFIVSFISSVMDERKFWQLIEARQNG